MEGHAIISHDVLASYAADAARGVEGVHELVSGPRRHDGVRVSEEEEGEVKVEVYVELDWGALAPDVGAAVQGQIAGYLGRMAKLRSVAVDVVIAGVAFSTD